MNNIKCGKHGRCVNSQTDFKCLCSFPYNGTYCDSVSLKHVQLLIAIPIIILAPILFTEPIRNLLWKVIKRLTPSNTNRKNKKINQQSEGATSHIGQPTFFQLEPDEKRTRLIFVSIVSLVFFLILIGNPIVRYLLISSTNHTTVSTLNSITNDNIYMTNQYGRNTIFRLDNIVFFIFSIGISVILIICNKKPQSDDKHHSSISSFFMHSYFALKEFFFEESSNRSNHFI